MLERTNKGRNFARSSRPFNGTEWKPQKQNIRVKKWYFKLHEKRWIISDT